MLKPEVTRYRLPPLPPGLPRYVLGLFCCALGPVLPKLVALRRIMHTYGIGAFRAALLSRLSTVSMICTTHACKLSKSPCGNRAHDQSAQRLRGYQDHRGGRSVMLTLDNPTAKKPPITTPAMRHSDTVSMWMQDSSAGEYAGKYGLGLTLSLLYSQKSFGGLLKVSPLMIPLSLSQHYGPGEHTYYCDPVSVTASYSPITS